MQGGLSINYSDNYYLLSQRHAEVPRLTQQHHEAMALFNEIASSDALRMDAMLQPGDVQLLNNHTQLHTREKFEDFPVSYHVKLKFVTFFSNSSCGLWHVFWLSFLCYLGSSNYDTAVAGPSC